jgi:predicted dehydrogenase|tara:strand:- start:202 stop:1056 length:855 start_codon:yes stop_codon:yes gene_type:complete
MRIAVIGTGRWGTNIANTVEQKYDCVRIDLGDSVNYDYDAAIIATPAPTHHFLANEHLAKNIPVLIEKPVSILNETVQHICDVAQSNNTVCQAGHILCFTPNTQWIKNSYPLDTLKMFESRRLNWGTIPQGDVDLELHLSVHDLALLDYLKGEEIQSVQKFSEFTTECINADYAIWKIDYNSFSAMLHAGWHYPQKCRSVTLIGKTKSVFADDNTDTIDVYEGRYLNSLTTDHKETITHHDELTPLAKQIDNFVFSIMTNNLESINGISHIRRVYNNLEKLRNV